LARFFMALWFKFSFCFLLLRRHPSKNVAAKIPLIYQHQ
jgi:hypothetical protein